MDNANIDAERARAFMRHHLVYKHDFTAAEANALLAAVEKMQTDLRNAVSDVLMEALVSVPEGEARKQMALASAVAVVNMGREYQELIA